MTTLQGYIWYILNIYNLYNVSIVGNKIQVINELNKKDGKIPSQNYLAALIFSAIAIAIASAFS